MYLSHTFHSRESLCLAHNWLTRLGFHARQSASGAPRIIVVDDPYRLDAARLLIDAAEHAESTHLLVLNDQPPPAGTDGGNGRRQDDLLRPHEPHHAALGWHPVP